MSFHVEMASYESFSAVASALASSKRSKASQVKTGRLIASRPREFIEAIYFGNDFACKRFPQRWILPAIRISGRGCGAFGRFWPRSRQYRPRRLCSDRHAAKTFKSVLIRSIHALRSPRQQDDLSVFPVQEFRHYVAHRLTEELSFA